MPDLNIRSGQWGNLPTFLNAIKDLALNADYKFLSSLVRSFGIVPHFEGFSTGDALGDSFKPVLDGSRLVIYPGKAVWVYRTDSPRGIEHRFAVLENDASYQIELSSLNDGDYYVWIGIAEKGEAPLVRLAPKAIQDSTYDPVYIEHEPSYNITPNKPADAILIAKVSVSGGSYSFEDLRYANVFSLREELFWGVPSLPRFVKLQTFISNHSETPKDPQSQTVDMLSVGKKLFLKIIYGGEIKGTVDSSNTYRFTIQSENPELLSPADLPTTGNLWGYVLEINDKRYRVASINNDGTNAYFEMFDSLPEGSFVARFFLDVEAVEIEIIEDNGDLGEKQIGSIVQSALTNYYVVGIKFDQKYKIRIRSRNKGYTSGWNEKLLNAVSKPAESFPEIQNFRVCSEGNFSWKKKYWVKLTWDFDPGDLVDYFWGYSLKMEIWIPNGDGFIQKDKTITFAGKDVSGTIVTDHTLLDLSPGSRVRFYLAPIDIFGGYGSVVEFPGNVANCGAVGDCTAVNCAAASETISDVIYIVGGAPPVPVLTLTEGTGFYSARVSRGTYPDGRADLVSDYVELKYKIGDSAVQTIHTGFDVDYLIPLPLMSDEVGVDKKLTVWAAAVTEGGLKSDYVEQDVTFSESDASIKVKNIVNGLPYDVASEVVIARGNTAALPERLNGVVDESGYPREYLVLRYQTVPIIEPVTINSGEIAREPWEPSSSPYLIDQTALPSGVPWSIVWVWRLDFDIEIKEIYFLNLSKTNGAYARVDIFFDFNPSDDTEAVLKSEITIPEGSEGLGIQEPAGFSPYILTKQGYLFVVTTASSTDAGARWPAGVLTIKYKPAPSASYTYTLTKLS